MHSFDGTLEEAQAAIDFGLYVGINGWWVEKRISHLYSSCWIYHNTYGSLSIFTYCIAAVTAMFQFSSLKTDENLQVVKSLPLEKLLIETGTITTEILLTILTIGEVD